MGHIVEDINKPNIYAREYDKYLSYNRGLKEKK